MEEQENMPEAIEDPQYAKYRIEEEVKAAAFLKEKELEMDKQIAYSEKMQLRQFKLEAFKLASSIRPSNCLNGQSLNQYSAMNLIQDAEKIYESLIK